MKKFLIGLTLFASVFLTAAECEESSETDGENRETTTETFYPGPDISCQIVKDAETGEVISNDCPPM